MSPKPTSLLPLLLLLLLQLRFWLLLVLLLLLLFLLLLLLRPCSLKLLPSKQQKLLVYA
jgi:hypothetical protein